MNEMATASVSLSESEDRRSGSPSQASDEDLTGPNPTRDALADGIVSLLSPTLKTLDEGVLCTKRSQEELSEQIALLTDQLKLISAEQFCPIDLDGYVNRLGTIKGKINVISSVLHSAQERLNRVHEQAVKEASRRKPLIEPSPLGSTIAPPSVVLSQESQEEPQSTASTSQKDNNNSNNPSSTGDGGEALKFSDSDREDSD